MAARSTTPAVPATTPADPRFIRPRTTAEKEIVLSNDQRIELARMISEGKVAFDRFEDGCVDYSEGSAPMLSNRVLLDGMLGLGSENAEAFAACFPAKCILERSSGGSKGVGAGCAKAVCDPRDAVPLAVKLVPLDESSIPHVNAPFGQGALRTNTFAEIALTLMASELVRQGVCPNLPLIYRVYRCDACRYVNQALLKRDFPTAFPERFARLVELERTEREAREARRTKREGSSRLAVPLRRLSEAVRGSVSRHAHEVITPKGHIKIREVAEARIALRNPMDTYTYLDAMNDSRAGAKDANLPCLAVLNELANGGNANQWLAHKVVTKTAVKEVTTWTVNPRSEAEWMGFIFQCLAGLAAMEKYAAMEHWDTHFGNFLVHLVKTPRGMRAVFRYRLDGRDFYLPILGHVFELWDMGYATVLGRVPNGQGERRMYADLLATQYTLDGVGHRFSNGHAYDVGRWASLVVYSNEEPYVSVRADLEARKVLRPLAALRWIYRRSLVEGTGAREMISLVFSGREAPEDVRYDLASLRAGHSEEDITHSFDMDKRLSDVPESLSHLFVQDMLASHGGAGLSLRRVARIPIPTINGGHNGDTSGSGAATGHRAQQLAVPSRVSSAVGAGESTAHTLSVPMLMEFLKRQPYSSSTTEAVPSSEQRAKMAHWYETGEVRWRLLHSSDPGNPSTSDHSAADSSRRTTMAITRLRGFAVDTDAISPMAVRKETLLCPRFSRCIRRSAVGSNDAGEGGDSPEWKRTGSNLVPEVWPIADSDPLVAVRESKETRHDVRYRTGGASHHAPPPSPHPSPSVPPTGYIGASVGSSACDKLLTAWLLNEIVLQNVCPNFPVTSQAMICDHAMLPVGSPLLEVPFRAYASARLDDMVRNYKENAKGSHDGPRSPSEVYLRVARITNAPAPARPRHHHPGTEGHAASARHPQPFTLEDSSYTIGMAQDDAMAGKKWAQLRSLVLLKEGDDTGGGGKGTRPHSRLQDGRTWLLSVERTPAEVESLLFQALVALSTIEQRTRLRLPGASLSLRNLRVLEMPPASLDAHGSLRYIMSEKLLQVPTAGTMVLVEDLCPETTDEVSEPGSHGLLPSVLPLVRQLHLWSAVVGMGYDFCGGETPKERRLYEKDLTDCMDASLAVSVEHDEEFADRLCRSRRRFIPLEVRSDSDDYVRLHLLLEKAIIACSSPRESRVGSCWDLTQDLYAQRFGAPERVTGTRGEHEDPMESNAFLGSKRFTFPEAVGHLVR